LEQKRKRKTIPSNGPIKFKGKEGLGGGRVNLCLSSMPDRDKEEQRKNGKRLLKLQKKRGRHTHTQKKNSERGDAVWRKKRRVGLDLSNQQQRTEPILCHSDG